MEKKRDEQEARLKISALSLTPEINKLERELFLYDETTYNHCQNVAYIAAQLCFLMQLDEEYTDEIIKGALIHDIGKILIPKNILFKKKTLRAEEFQTIKEHPLLGLEIIDTLKYKFSDVVREIVKYHHEKPDGTGYPEYLTEKQIPLHARIVSIVDCYDAMTAKRCYGFIYPGDLAISTIYRENKKEKKAEEILKVLERCVDR